MNENDDVLDKWLPINPSIQLKYGKCIVCGVGLYWNAKKKPRRLCVMCDSWVEGYRRRNKQQINLFGGM